MSVTAVVLVVFSALVHAGWNLLGKRDSANGAYFCIASAAGALVMFPILLFWSGAVGRMPPGVWMYLLPTGLFQALYFTGLGGAYRTGDLSVAYPVARAFPVLMVPLISAAMGSGDLPTATAVGGMITVTVGLLVIPQDRISRLSVSHLWGAWVLYAFLAGIGTTGYSIIDDTALATYRETLGGELSSVQAPIIYSALQSASTALLLALFGAVRLGPRRLSAELRRTQLGSAATAGVAIVGAYCLVLVAYGFARNVSYVVAFRQISLPIGTLFGVVLLGEKMNRARAAGTALIIGGLVLVSLG